METVKLCAGLPEKAPKALPFAAENPRGLCLGANSRYLTKNGKPWFPIMGEFHFSRCPEAEWKTELEKMRAGGIEIVSTYILWIHHEEKKGEWDFSGQRSLRRFLELCRETGLFAWLRIGPWVHAEARNGGFPDWLANDASVRPRTNDPAYLAHVKEFYQKIMEQSRGLFFRDGGPVIGVQIENEYGHCGGMRGEEGLLHMRALKKLAEEIGFAVPYYTATGWGGAVVVEGEMLPVHGGYADAPWDSSAEPLPANGNFLISPERNDALIGSDWGSGDRADTFRAEENPYLTAELGGGLEPTKRRRPVASGTDTAAMAFCKVASGANLLGYYMYHGGTNPQGRYSTLHEAPEERPFAEVPTLSYDFQAPIGEYGELGPSYRKLKRLHLFLREFGEWVAPAECTFPENPVTNAEDTRSLRLSLRHNRALGGGFVLINNHQRLRHLDAHKVQIRVEADGRFVLFPEIQVEDHDFGAYPYCLPLGDAFLESSNAQLLCRLREKYVFVCREKPVFRFRGPAAKVLVLSPEEAENAWKFGGTLYLTRGDLSLEGGSLRLVTEQTAETIRALPDGQSCAVTFRKRECGCSARPLSETPDTASYELDLDAEPAGACFDVILELQFSGGRAELYSESGRMVADWFSLGTPWRVGLRRLGFPKKLVLRICRDEGPVYYECAQDGTLRLLRASLHPKYGAKIPVAAFLGENGGQAGQEVNTHDPEIKFGKIESGL